MKRIEVSLLFIMIFWVLCIWAVSGCGPVDHAENLSPTLEDFETATTPSTFDSRMDRALAEFSKKDMKELCGRSGTRLQAQKVTHYYMPLLQSFKKGPCHNMEGVCRYKLNGVEMLANYGRKSVPLSKVYCKNGIGYGLQENCVHPCRSLAASIKHHRPGELIYFRDLVGLKCGTGANAMIHDGFMVVNDTGAKKHFNRQGRFDFFWGECRNSKGGVCRDSGAREIAATLSRSSYCRAWRPTDPVYNQELRHAFTQAVRSEAIRRGDLNAANFDLDDWVGPKATSVAANFRSKRQFKSRKGLRAGA